MAAFVALVVATIAAFFITQHLKASTPFIGQRVLGPLPFSDNGDGCRHFASINFYLQHRSDSVSVFVIDSEGNMVQTIASGVEMHKPTTSNDAVRRTFRWYGQESNGQPAPDGTYYFQVALSHQGRNENLTQNPIIVDNVPPHLVVTRVSPSQLPALGAAPATVNFTGSRGRAGYLIIYRTGVAGPPREVAVRDFYQTKRNPHGYTKAWAGTIDGRPAPAGTYVMALKVTDRACVTGTFPAYLPPREGTTPHAGLTIQYLAAEPPVDPVPAGSVAVVGVASGRHRYRWALRRVGMERKTIKSGAGSATSLRIRLPGRSAGLYELAIRAAGHRTVVPIVARAPAARHRILVVLPALSWQGENPVDDNGDGFPDTLTAGDPIELDRPLADGLPSGFTGEAALLAYLDRTRMPYDLTTDIALADGTGPTLAGHSGVVFAGPEVWLPAALAPELKRYAEQGGRVLSLGVGSLRRTATVKDANAGPEALDPTPVAATDVLGARPGALVRGNTDSIVVITDRLGLFKGTSGAFDFASFEPIPTVAAPGRIESEAGTSVQTASIVGYRLGSGIVVDVGLPTFTLRLAHDVDSQELLRRLWAILSR